MRIVHVITRFIRGGADENTLYSCNAQAERGYEVHLVHGAEWHPDMLRRLHPSVVCHEVTSLVRPLRPWRDLAATIDLLRLFRRLAPDIVHTHTSKAGVVGRLAAIAARVTGVVHGVHILPFLNVSPVAKAVFLAVERALAPSTRAFVNVSEAMLAEGVQYGVGRREAHVVVPSGMDTQRYAEAMPLSASEVSEELGLALTQAESLEIVLMVAALEPRKRQYEFLTEFQRVAQVRPNAFLVLAGDGVERPRLASRARDLGLSDRVAIIGFREDVERWMARAEVCVLASEREGLPRAIIQYVLARRPVVATALPGVEAVVRSDLNGRLVGTDLRGMGESILEILSDRDLAAKMSREAGEIDLSAWSVRGMADALDRVYQQVLLVGASGQLSDSQLLDRAA